MLGWAPPPALAAPGTSLAIVKAMFVSPATVAVELFDLLPRPTTGMPLASLTVKLTTGALLIVTPVIVTCGESAAHAAALSLVAGVLLLGTCTAAVASAPGAPSAPGGPAGPAGPAGPCAPSSPPQPARAAATRAARANLAQCGEGRQLADWSECFTRVLLGRCAETNHELNAASVPRILMHSQGRSLFQINRHRVGIEPKVDSKIAAEMPRHRCCPGTMQVARQARQRTARATS